MNFLTKTFVVLVTVLSILLVAVTVSTIARYDNVNQNVRNLQTRLSSAQSRARTAQADMTEIQQSHAQQVATLERRSGQLQDQVRQLQSQLASAQNNLNKDKTRLQELKASVSSLSSNTQTQGQLIGTLSENLDKWRTQATESGRRNVELTDQIARVQGEQEALGRQVSSLQEKLASRDQNLQRLQNQFSSLPQDVRDQYLGGGGNQQGGQQARVVEPETPIPGSVSQVRQDGQSTYVQVNVGSSDGVKEGMQFMVYRNDTYLGRMAIQAVNSNSAVGRMTLTRDQVESGDQVLAGAAF